MGCVICFISGKKDNILEKWIGNTPRESLRLDAVVENE